MLEMKGITKRFGGLTAVDQVDLIVKKGEILGLIGPNGAGKTTFFNILTGIYRPDQGNIQFNGTDITGFKPYQIANQGIFRTFQNIRLLKDYSVLDNIKLGLFRQTKAGAWSSIFGLRRSREEEKKVAEESWALLERLGLTDLANEAAGNLSYGNQRRVEIARALVSHPEMILLDEPAAGMNSEEVESLSALVRQIRQQGTTVILIEHNVGMVVELCDRLVVLDHGVKIADGDPNQVVANPAVIEAYIGGQEVTEVVGD
nr:ABC transporter ATP-binding protein [Seinonella peptonophila]